MLEQYFSIITDCLEYCCKNKVITEKLNYIHNNPVEAGIVEVAHLCKYSIAKNYAREKGQLGVVIL